MPINEVSFLLFLSFFGSFFGSIFGSFSRKEEITAQTGCYCPCQHCYGGFGGRPNKTIVLVGSGRWQGMTAIGGLVVRRRGSWRRFARDGV